MEIFRLVRVRDAAAKATRDAPLTDALVHLPRHEISLVSTTMAENMASGRHKDAGRQNLKRATPGTL